MPRKSKARELANWLAEQSPARVGEAEFARLQAELAPISEDYLRTILRNSGVPLDPMIEGVRQSNLEELEATLLALLDEYDRGDKRRRMDVRRLVIAAQNHARLALAKASHEEYEKRDMRQETLLWLATWLENPSVFRQWVVLRKRGPGYSPG